MQLVRSSDQEIDERKASVQRFYGISLGEDDDRFLTELRAVEQSNAETLAVAIEREHSLRQSYDRIEHASELFRPIVAAKDVAGYESGPRTQIARTVLDSFASKLDLSFAAAVYGLFLGSPIGEPLTAALLPRHRLAR